MSEVTRYWLECHRRRREAKGSAYTPREQSIFDAMAAISITKHESIHTAATYGANVVEFFRWLKKHPSQATATSEEKVTAYLSSIAPNCAAKTQKQKLCSILRYYQDVLRRPLGKLPHWAYAKVSRRLPVCLTQTETRRLLDVTEGTTGLILQLAYAAGLRIMEVSRLRVKDVDLEGAVVTVRGGKGDKDRTLPIAACLVAPLRQHLARVRSLWEGDAAQGRPPVQLPAGLERKYPKAGATWAWFWLFPACNLSRDPGTGTTRRHHVHPNGIGKALSLAVRRAGIAKHVTAHVLRHSFATHHLLRGTNLRDLQDLMGHNSIENTQVYLHCLPREVNRSGSPLDDLIAAPADCAAVPFQKSA